MDIKSQGPSSLGRNRLIYSSVCEVTACGRARGTHRSPGAHGQDGALLLLLLLLLLLSCRSVSDPNPKSPERMFNPCPFAAGLRTQFPQFKFPVRGTEGTDDFFGLTSDKDTMWTKEREEQEHQVRTCMHDAAGPHGCLAAW